MREEDRNPALPRHTLLTRYVADAAAAHSSGVVKAPPLPKISISMVSPFLLIPANAAAGVPPVKRAKRVHHREVLRRYLYSVTI